MPDTITTAVAAAEPEPFPIARCKSCQARIIYAWTERSKLAPIDAEPSPEGTITLYWSGKHVQSRVVKPASLRFGRKDLHTSHFATCPNASTHRARAGRRTGS